MNWEASLNENIFQLFSVLYKKWKISTGKKIITPNIECFRFLIFQKPLILAYFALQFINCIGCAHKFVIYFIFIEKWLKIFKMKTLFIFLFLSSLVVICLTVEQNSKRNQQSYSNKKNAKKRLQADAPLPAKKKCTYDVFN